MFGYRVALTLDGNTLQVTFADMPGAPTSGADEGEALSQTVKALETALSSSVAARKPLPAARA